VKGLGNSDAKKRILFIVFLNDKLIVKC